MDLLYLPGMREAGSILRPEIPASGKYRESSADMFAEMRDDSQSEKAEGKTGEGKT